MNNYTCIKYSISTQVYKVLNTHAHEISGFTILSRLIHQRTPNIGGMNGDVQYDVSNLEFNNWEQLEYFHSKTLRQDIIFFGETLSPTRLLVQYMKAFSNFKKLKAFIVPKMIDIITFPDNNGKSAVYTGVIFMNSIFFWKWLDTQLNWQPQFSAIIILVLHLTPTIIQQLSSQLFQISVWDRRVFENYEEVLDTSMMPVSSMALNSSHQVLE